MCELAIIAGFAWNRMDKQDAVQHRYSAWRQHLPDQDEIESLIIELGEEVLDRTVRLQLDPQPRETIAGVGRRPRKPRQGFR